MFRNQGQAIQHGERGVISILRRVSAQLGTSKDEWTVDNRHVCNSAATSAVLLIFNYTQANSIYLLM